MERFEIIVNPTGGKKAIALSELSEFLRCFEQSYALANYYYCAIDHKGFIKSGSKSEVERLKLFFSKNKNIEMSLTHTEPLLFDSINTNSPLKFVGYCSGVSILALSLSVALAGGEVDLTNNTFKVNSLTEAVGNYKKQISEIEGEPKEPEALKHKPRRRPSRF
ncbi:hypothetical protein [Vibrio splendidus]|uniref:hypothetical protein n=2 Tax=Vibrio TaxID=662 RepID=UPI000C81FBE5|nr:hypothetical protein [Vibrio splendidus]PMM10579.1 hypothetical protein BCT62_11440 [Vibrio splendidus]PMN27999.1 hypothetical protein BCT36_25450 [Vibrio splendidus]